jgi:hypothetical protein
MLWAKLWSFLRTVASGVVSYAIRVVYVVTYSLWYLVCGGSLNGF